VSFRLLFTPEAEGQLNALREKLPKRAKKVRRALGYLETNPRHPSLQTHEFVSLSQLLGVKVFEAYAETETPAAYLIFWYYGPQKEQITIYSITPHP
jgi:hypothetical protein